HVSVAVRANFIVSLGVPSRRRVSSWVMPTRTTAKSASLWGSGPSDAHPPSRRTSARIRRELIEAARLLRRDQSLPGGDEGRLGRGGLHVVDRRRLELGYAFQAHLRR